MDAQRRCAIADCLWPRTVGCAHVSGRCVCHVCRGVGGDRKFLDHDCHPRRGADGCRLGYGLQSRMGGRSHHLRCIFRRQSVAAERHHRVGGIELRRASVHPHPLSDAHLRSGNGHCADNLSNSGDYQRPRTGRPQRRND